MNNDNFVSFEALNYFIDGQMLRAERIQILEALNKDEALSKTVCDLQRNDEFVRMAYSDIPEPLTNPYLAATARSGRKLYALVASFLIMISATASWQLNTYTAVAQDSRIMTIQQLSSASLTNNKVLIHLNKMDDQKIKATLDRTESLLAENKNLRINIIANESALGMLRANSPYAERIRSLANKYPNIKFKACGLAMQTAKLKEGKTIKLLPEAEKIPAALDAILQHLKENWSYFKV